MAARRRPGSMRCLAEHQWIIAQYPEAGADRCLGRQSRSGRLVLAGAARGGQACAGRLAAERTVTRSRAAATMRNGRSSAPFSARRATRGHRLSAGAARRDRDRRRLADARPRRHRQQVAGAARRVRARASLRHGQRPVCRHPAGRGGASRLPGLARAARLPRLLFVAAGARSRSAAARSTSCAATSRAGCRAG